VETLVVSIAVGLVISLLFTEAFGLTVGGMIVPGYLALYLDQPLTILLTLIAAIDQSMVDPMAAADVNAAAMATVIGFIIPGLIALGLC
jgi:hypothetical protein